MSLKEKSNDELLEGYYFLSCDFILDGTHGKEMDEVREELLSRLEQIENLKKELKTIQLMHAVEKRCQGATEYWKNKYDELSKWGAK